MANVKISELPAASTITRTETVPVVQGATTAKTTVAGILGAITDADIPATIARDAEVTTAVNAAVAALVAAAPATLDTLDELAAALGDDANFASTMTTALAGKAATGHTHTYVDPAIADAKGDLIVATAADTLSRLAVGTNDFVLTADSAQSTGVKWAAAAGGSSGPVLSRMWPNAVTNFGLPGWSEVAGWAAGLGASAGSIYYTPIYVDGSTAFDRICINVTTAGAASTLARLGIYRADATNEAPGTLVVDAGTVDVATTGEKLATISQTLTSGMYWLAFVSNGGPTCKCPMTSFASNTPAGVPLFRTLGLGSQAANGAWVAQTTGRTADVAGGLSSTALAVDTNVNGWSRSYPYLRFV